jgi:hypothetical protein
MRYEQRRHARFIHADADAVARDAWLRYFEYSIANAVSIADADLVIRKPFDSEVFTELTKSKITAAQNALPVVVRIHLVDKHSAVFPSVTSEVALPITVDVELAHHGPSRKRRFPDCGSDNFAVPRYIARKAGIYRDQASHLYLFEIRDTAWIG